MSVFDLSRFSFCALCLFTFVSSVAEAAIDTATVNTSREYEQARNYTYAEITIGGAVMRPDGTAGRYSVPAVIIYPREHVRHGDGTGVGVVDLLTTSFYHFFPPIDDARTIQFTLLTTEKYLFEQGYTYLSVQWDKAVTEIFGDQAPPGPHNHLAYGSIERGADAWEILLDAARLLKDPRAFEGSDRPRRVSTVLASGYSQGSALQLEMLAERLDSRRVYDGHLITMIGHVCWKRTDEAPLYGSLAACGPLPTTGHHAPVMMLVSETDMVFYGSEMFPIGRSAYFTRNSGNPNWRQYELAGVAHIPRPVLPVGPLNQNSADPRPAYRAAFANLTRWTHGICWNRPPAPKYFEGFVDPAGTFIPTPDPDGHFAGGLRLPHVESAIHGRTAGAPLGTHKPINDAATDVFGILGGTFDRFGIEEILARYPVQFSYVKRVKRAADHLEDKDYILDQDRRALITAAEQEPLYDDDGND
jgi:hypothetical protein